MSIIWHKALRIIIKLLDPNHYALKPVVQCLKQHHFLSEIAVTVN